MSFYRERWIKATHKPHICWWCGSRIEQGSAAQYSACLTEDYDIFTGHAHPECAAALDAMPSADHDEGYMPHEHARGRRDDDRKQPPEFSDSYRGRQAAMRDQTEASAK